MDKRQQNSVDKLRGYAEKVAAAKRALDKATRSRDEWITRCVDAGVSPAEVARVAGVSRGRVSQIAPVPKAPEPRVHAQKKGGDALCVNDPDTVPVLPDTPSLLSGIASTRKRTPYGRTTMFYDVSTGAVAGPNVTPNRRPGFEPGSVADILDAAAEHGHGRVFLTGPAPAAPGATRAESVRAWALAGAAGWTAESHYLADADLPVLRFVADTIAFGGKPLRVTIMRAASWWGESDADVATCAAAWAGLERALDAIPAFAGAGMADTPATTGRALWLRTIPEGKGYPVMCDELRELIAATSGQGRIERRPAPAATGQDFTYLDGRFMYAALTWGMPVGEPRRWTAAEIDALSARDFTKAIRGRGRWRITCTVPAGWDHVGMFMVADDDAGRWQYPNRPGQTFTTWADGSEVWAGMERGWEPVFHEGITWDEGKPLDSWHDALVSVWESANANGSPAARLAARAVRSLVLFTIGAFAARSHPVTRTATDPAMVPAGAEVRRVGDALVWTETATPSAWTLQTAHPEWSATVWARARTRLLTGRGVGQERVGALHLPAERIVAFATDALYVAGGSPGWADDGKPGRFRVKGTRPGAFDWPETAADLYRLRDEAEAAGNGE